jgi:predicted DCC family thiol-disulfide oxidoreductase YuxK
MKSASVPPAASKPGSDGQKGEIFVVYDGECPFCSRYIMLYRIRQNVGRVHLIDARESDHALVREISAKGLDLNNGMVVKWDDRIYYGADALNVLAMLGSEQGIFSRINQMVFSKPKLAKAIYPTMVAGRKLTLRMLGRQPIVNV